MPPLPPDEYAWQMPVQLNRSVDPVHIRLHKAENDLVQHYPVLAAHPATQIHMLLSQHNSQRRSDRSRQRVAIVLQTICLTVQPVLTFQASLEHHWQPEHQEVSEPETKAGGRRESERKLESFTDSALIDWGEATDVSTFYGRLPELELLHQWSNSESPNQRCRLICLLGMGGIGKTSLSVKLAQGQSDRHSLLESSSK